MKKITLFEEKPVEGKDREFAKQWISYTRETLMWPTEKIAFIASSLEVDYDKYLQEKMAVNDLKKGAIVNSETSCGCSIGSDFCGSSLTCTSGTCSSSGSGCGWFWMDNCNGKCSY